MPLLVSLVTILICRCWFTYAFRRLDIFNMVYFVL
ncbi:unnamed protein product [Brassica oleracea]